MICITPLEGWCYLLQLLPFSYYLGVVQVLAPTVYCYLFAVLVLFAAAAAAAVHLLLLSW
jgi:hypothetical protein